MIQQFSSLSSATGFAIADHLWQSTLFLMGAALVTLVLRENQARIRYRVWLITSLKFLVPFSLLISAAGRLAPHFLSNHQRGGLLATVDAIGQPFTFYVTTAAHPASTAYLVYLLVIAGWSAGFVAVLAQWWLAWRQTEAAQVAATPLTGGREFDALRQLERAGKRRRPISIFLSEGNVEPGVFGIVRPVLLWPAAISAELEDAHLRAILAHEIAHVRRRDNLAAAAHMVVEAFFWFHPLVWWLGARLVEERERACDEAVLQQGHAPQVYAEGILKTCAFCVASPLPCVSGVTGAELNQRVVRIVSQKTAQKLSSTRKLMLTSLGIASIAAPLILGLLHTPRVAAQTQPSEATPHVYHVGGDITSPKLTYAPDPQFSEQAVRAKYQGVCVIATVVDAEGKPQQVHAVRHLKYGLDEKAIEAVQQYKFEPGTLHGQPVAVEVHIEVNFRRY